MTPTQGSDYNQLLGGIWDTAVSCYRKNIAITNLQLLLTLPGVTLAVAKTSPLPI